MIEEALANVQVKTFNLACTGALNFKLISGGTRSIFSSFFEG